MTKADKATTPSRSILQQRGYQPSSIQGSPSKGYQPTTGQELPLSRLPTHQTSSPVGRSE